MTKISVFIATSLDGFIARSDGRIDWLDRANSVLPSGEDCGYKQFMATVDGIIVGRNTFEQVLTFGEWPYNKPVVILSRKGAPIPAALQSTVSTSAEAPKLLVQRLSRQGMQHLYIDGGQTIQSFLRAGLIDELTITVIPILLGEGKPLFGAIESDLMLQHLRTQVYDFGFVQHQYRVINSRISYEN